MTVIRMKTFDLMAGDFRLFSVFVRQDGIERTVFGMGGLREFLAGEVIQDAVQTNPGVWQWRSAKSRSFSIKVTLQKTTPRNG